MVARDVTPFGQLLRYWRTARKRSQLDLALAADVSARHLSFIETGRSQPSREMVLLLAEVLDVPLRERNALLHAAGFAPAYGERGLDHRDMAPVRAAVQFMLERHEPYPAVALDRHWNIVTPNLAATRLFAAIVPREVLAVAPLNVMRVLFDPAVRPRIVNWREVSAVMIQRLHREVLAAPDRDAEALLASLLAGDVPPDWRTPDLSASPAVMVPLHVRTERIELRLFSVIATLGTAIDVTAQELHVETFFPADADSEATLRGLAGAIPPAT